MSEIHVYKSDGQYRDEGGNFDYETIEIPKWVEKARQHCMGCHDNFYNFRANCGNMSWCFSLKKEFARLKKKPKCYH